MLDMVFRNYATIQYNLNSPAVLDIWYKNVVYGLPYELLNNLRSQEIRKQQKNLKCGLKESLAGSTLGLLSSQLWDAAPLTCIKNVSFSFEILNFDMHFCKMQPQECLFHCYRTFSLISRLYPPSVCRLPSKSKSLNPAKYFDENCRIVLSNKQAKMYEKFV